MYALDIFKPILQNRGIKNKLDAWLAFLSVDDPEWVEKLAWEYPEKDITIRERDDTIREQGEKIKELLAMVNDLKGSID